jgi:hypothetical protein
MKRFMCNDIDILCPWMIAKRREYQQKINGIYFQVGKLKEERRKNQDLNKFPKS